MSGFNDNIFGGQIDNPFADPSVQQVAHNTTNTQRGLEDYNPFEDDNPPQSHQPPRPVQIGQPAIVQPTNEATSAYTQYTQPQITTEDLQRRQEELERKAAELERRERELRSNTEPVRRNNWPPLPEKCCFQPCFYHEIQVDIPSEFQRVVRHLYYVWIMYAGVMCVNIIGAMVLMIHARDFSTFGLSILFAFLFTPASWLCWYRPAYKAFRNDSSFNFMVFFFVYFFQMVVTIIQTIGIPGMGTCGFIIALEQFDSSVGGIFVGLFLLLIAIGFGTCAAGDVMMLTKIHSIYRSSGASFAKAQAEFTTEFMRNPHVQQAATNAASAAVNAQMNNRY
ncbi:secretory carrier-associated membrane protein 1 [Phlebotomus papatasi]|nr:secretory carrier-associated membrane protein 1 [Phlebotomus papatasi]